METRVNCPCAFTPYVDGYGERADTPGPHCNGLGESKVFLKR